MRIVHHLRALIAVLGLAAVIHLGNCQLHFNNTIYEEDRRTDYHNWSHVLYNHNVSLLHEPGMFLNHRENHQLLRHEARHRDIVDCCPPVLEMIEPEGGENVDGNYVELYRDGNYRQRFYELSCHKDIVNKPCRFMDKKVHNESQCMQTYSYTYALVKDPGLRDHQRMKNFPTFPAGPGGTTWTLDYIKVRSGCSCVVKAPKLKHQKRNRHKHHKRKLHKDER